MAIEPELNPSPDAERSLDGPDRIPLRFFSLLDRPAPAGFMHMDEALDHLGVKRFPEQWGRLAGWQQHPFRYELKTNKFLTYRFERDEDKSYHLDRCPVAETIDKSALLVCDQIYKHVVSELATALEMGAVQAFHASSSHQPEPIPTGSMYWSKQTASAFYVGCLRIAGRRRVLLLSRASFESWLEPSRTAQPQAGRALSEALINRISQALAEHANATGLKYKRDRLFEAVKAVFDEARRSLSQAQFERIWTHEALRSHKHLRGKPPKALDDALKREAGMVRAIISDAYAGRTHADVPAPVTPATNSNPPS